MKRTIDKKEWEASVILKLRKIQDQYITMAQHVSCMLNQYEDAKDEEVKAVIAKLGGGFLGDGWQGVCDLPLKERGLWADLEYMNTHEEVSE